VTSQIETCFKSIAGSRMSNHDGPTTIPTLGNKMNYVRFDVGSTLHLCHRDTLLMFPNSALAKYIAPEFDLRESESDFILIDRDGKHFGAILNWMRDPSSLDLDLWPATSLVELKSEADFYGLTELLEKVELNLQRKLTKNYKVPKEHEFRVLTHAEDVESFLKRSQKPTFLFAARVVVGLIESRNTEFLERFDHSRFNVVFVTYFEEYIIKLIPAGETEPTDSLWDRRSSTESPVLCKIYEFVLRHQIK